MWPLVIAWIALLVVSAILAQQTLHLDLAQLPAHFVALPVLQQVFLILVIILAAYLMASAIRQSSRLARYARRLEILSKRLNSVREAASAAEGSQQNLSSAAEHLVASDPENAIAALQLRLTEAEQKTAAQKGRNEAVDMNARLDDIRRRQQALRSQLGDVTEQRRAIAPVFDELRQRQIQLDRSLAELETDANNVDIAERLHTITGGVMLLQGRVKALEETFTKLNGFKDQLTQSQSRIAPLRTPDAGIEALLVDLQARHAELHKDLDEFEQRGGDRLSARVDALAKNKLEIEQRMAGLTDCSAALEEIRAGFDELRERKAYLERSLSEVETDASGKTLAERQSELSEFTNQSRARVLALENALIMLNRFKDDLDKYQIDLVPLQSPVSGIDAVMSELHGRHGHLNAALDEIDLNGGERLKTRVESIYRSKMETEQRIAEAIEHFGRLDSLRKEVEGLFAKLSFTVGRLT